jgi:YD repeat-containing protein
MLKINLFIVLVFFAVRGTAQENKVITASPEASSLAKFINYPVNYSTGLANINIPLLEIRSGDILLPITLNYHAGGIKVNEKSTWVGLGWQLSAEPEITRKINNHPDEISYLQGNNAGEYATHNLAYLKTMVYGGRDEEPDEFYYKLANNSGKYYYSKNSDGTYKAFPVPYAPIKINNNIHNNTITDVDGSLYRFGTSLSGAEATEVGDQVNKFTTSWKCTEIISASKKDTVFFAYGSQFDAADYMFNERYEIFDKITTSSTETWFSTYDTAYPEIPASSPFQVNTRVNNVNIYDGSINNESFGTYHSIFDPATGNVTYTKVKNASSYADAVFTNTKKTIKVKEIRYKSGRVQFFKHLNANILDSIRVFDHEGALVKSIKFYLTPWNQYPMKGVPSDRTRLDSLVIYDSGGKAVERYSFEYNPSNGMNYGEIKRSDPWGYYVGGSYFDPRNSVRKQNVTIFESNEPGRPQRSYDISIGSDFNANSSYGQSFLLRKIYYPTGGSTQFDYEANKYRSPQGMKNGGGFRIKSIKSFADNKSLIALEKNYTYGEKEDGEGFVKLSYDDPSYYTYEQTIHYMEPYIYYPFYAGDPPSVFRQPGTISERKRTYLSRPIVDWSFSNGAPTVYNTVTEYQKDNGLLTGKTVFKFDYDLQAAITETKVIGDITWQKDEWPRGSLLSETAYAYSNGKFTWVNKKETDYDNYYKKSIYVGKAFPLNIVVKGNDIPAFKSDPYENIYYLNYLLKSGCRLPVLQKEFTRSLTDTTRIFNTSKAFYFDNPNSIFPTREVFTNSLGDVTTTYITHPNDYNISDPLMGILQNANIISPEIERVTTLKHANDPGPKILNAVLDKYSPLGYKVSEHRIEPEAPYNLADFKFSVAPIGSLPDNLFGQYNFEPSQLYKIKNEYRYNNNGKLIQIVSKGISSTAYIWGYNNLYPVAEVKNSLPDEALFLSFEYLDPDQYSTAGIVLSVWHTGKACYDLAFGPITKTGLTTAKSYVVSYWTKNMVPYMISGTSGTPVLLKITNGWSLYAHKVREQQSISISGSGYIDDVRIHPENSEMSSYTYSPLVGMTSVTDSKGQVNYYKYDAAGRLTLVRDQDGNILKRYKYHYTR